MSAFDPNAAASEDSGIYGLPNTEKDSQVVLIPVPFDATTSYRPGTAKGPKAILKASKQVDLFDLDTGKPYEAGIFMLPEDAKVAEWNKIARVHAERVIEAGGLQDERPDLAMAAIETNRYSELVNDYVYAQTKRLLGLKKLVGVVGGDHASPFGAIKAVAEAHGGIGVLHLDAHADLRMAYEGFVWSHASIMHNVCEHIPDVGKLVQVGIRDFGEQEYDYIRANPERVRTFFDAELKARLDGGESWAKLCREIAESLPQKVFLSFDIDGLEPALCPSTGTPVPGGLRFHEAVALLRAVHAAKKTIVGLDLNEVAPSPDGKDEWDANVGARLLYKMIGFALKAPA